jgi:hypothetical protein
VPDPDRFHLLAVAALYADSMRTPFDRYRGSLATVRTDDLASKRAANRQKDKESLGRLEASANTGGLSKARSHSTAMVLFLDHNYWTLY